MFSRIFFLLVTVCAVNASVLTVNVFDVASNPKDCNPQACDQLCRRLKFPGGVCVNGRCKCDNFLNIEDEISEEKPSDLEGMVSLNDDPETEAVPSRCRDRPCDSVCRVLNYTSGACVDGRCKCTKSVVAEEIMTAESVARSSCNSIACDDKCRRTGWHSGVCINGQCKCDYFLNTEVSEELEDSVTPKRCTQPTCNNQCRGSGFRAGVCTPSRCACITFVSTPKDAMNDLEESISIDDDFFNDNFFNTEGIDEDSEETPVSELSEDQTERGCNQRACDQLCRRLKFPGGACVNGRCKCDNFFGTEVDAAAEYSELDTRRGCRITKCNRTCTRLGYDSATCVDRRCKCYNKTQIQDAVDEFSQLDTRRVCKLRQCNRTCTRRGYERARCVNGWCKCYNKIQREDASPLNEVTSDENEESNEISRTYEAELTDASPRACNTPSCNQMCHRLKYAGGWCRFGQCQCY